MKYPIEKMRSCLDLLPPPGGEVVAECLDEIELLRKQLASKDAEIAFLQSKVDELMLEYCPTEMTEGQLDNRAAHQQPMMEQGQ